MYIDDFIWLSDIVGKLAAKHWAPQDEAEDLSFNRPRYRSVERGDIPGEDVYAACRQTDASRYLIGFFIHKANRTALIVSARNMDRKVGHVPCRPCAGFCS